MAENRKIKCAGPDCEVEFIPPETAPHKKFHSSKCRNAFHGLQLKQLRAEVKKRKEEGRDAGDR